MCGQHRHGGSTERHQLRWHRDEGPKHLQARQGYVHMVQGLHQLARYNSVRRQHTSSHNAVLVEELQG
jgi:hypothetical protein